jgi:hypothetical protein
MIRIVFELWCSPVFRRLLKAKLRVLMDHFALRLLRLGPQLMETRRIHLSSPLASVSMFLQQIELVQEIKAWFNGDP